MTALLGYSLYMFGKGILLHIQDMITSWNTPNYNLVIPTRLFSLGEVICLMILGVIFRHVLSGVDMQRVACSAIHLGRNVLKGPPTGARVPQPDPHSLVDDVGKRVVCTDGPKIVKNKLNNDPIEKGMDQFDHISAIVKNIDIPISLRKSALSLLNSLLDSSLVVNKNEEIIGVGCEELSSFDCYAEIVDPIDVDCLLCLSASRSPEFGLPGDVSYIENEIMNLVNEGLEIPSGCERDKDAFLGELNHREFPVEASCRPAVLDEVARLQSLSPNADFNTLVSIFLQERRQNRKDAKIPKPIPQEDFAKLETINDLRYYLLAHSARERLYTEKGRIPVPQELANLTIPKVHEYLHQWRDRVWRDYMEKRGHALVVCDDCKLTVREGHQCFKAESKKISFQQGLPMHQTIQVVTDGTRVVQHKKKELHVETAAKIMEKMKEKLPSELIEVQNTEMATPSVDPSSIPPNSNVPSLPTSISQNNQLPISTSTNQAQHPQQQQQELISQTRRALQNRNPLLESEDEGQENDAVMSSAATTEKEPSFVTMKQHNYLKNQLNDIQLSLKSILSSVSTKAPPNSHSN